MSDKKFVSAIDVVAARAKAEREAEGREGLLDGATPSEVRHFRSWQRNGFRPSGGRFRL